MSCACRGGNGYDLGHVDTNPWLLAVSNGVLDLRTGLCREGEPSDYIRTVSPTEWTGIETPVRA